jgi:hypothetical protein
MSTLRLTIKKQWFDMIVQGIKTEEYRDCSKFYHTRINLISLQRDAKEYDKIQFFNGDYLSETLPNAIFELKSVHVGIGRQEWGAEPNKQYYVLTIGKRLNHYCQAHIEDRELCVTQCDHCKEYYKPLEK